ncbi:ribonuclease H-like domain-containing protein [Tanacetum coccineum]
MFDSRDSFPSKEISSPKDTETPVKSPIPVSPSSSVGSSSPVRSTTPPPDYFFDKSIFAKLDNLLWIIRRPLGSKPVLEKPDESDTYGTLSRYKARLVANGSTQLKGVDVDDTLSPVRKYAVEILERAHMVNCNHSRTLVDIESKLGVDGDPVSDLTLYQSLAGSL